MDSLLSLDHYGSSSDEESDISSSQEEEQEEETKEEKDREEEKSSISGADLLLEQTTKPSFITEHVLQQEKDKRMKERVQITASKTHSSTHEKNGEKKEQSKDALRQANKRAMQELLGETVNSNTIEEGESRKKKQRSIGSSTSGKDQEDGVNLHRERIKNKRLKGQSGIGEDFRVWRSDEEMRLRQQFDS